MSGEKPSRRPPRREILIVAGLGFAAFAITLSVLASRTAADIRGRAAAQLREIQASKLAPPLTSEELALSPDDFMLPQEPAARAPSYVPWRPRTPVWTKEMVGKYWIPPREIAADIVGVLNDREMKRLFEKVP